MMHSHYTYTNILFLPQLSFSPTIPLSHHVKVLVLLAVIQTNCAFLLLLSVFVGYVYAGINIFAFMAAEVRW